jgi:regulator of CtrA degradation
MGSEASVWGLAPKGITVSMAERLTGTKRFDSLFRQGMALVERTAAYLDGQGRRDARLLKSPMSLIYATESMRLTTNLLELASWLLILRALKYGDITREEARRKRQGVKLRGLARSTQVTNYRELPAGLRQLIEEAMALGQRLLQVEHALHGSAAEPACETVNPVAVHMAKLQAVFGGGVARSRNA